MSRRKLKETITGIVSIFYNQLSEAINGRFTNFARPCRPFSHKQNPFCLTARPQGAGRDERVSPARAGRNPKEVMRMGDAVEPGSHGARYTTRGRRSEVRLGRAPMGSEIRNWRAAKTRRATSFFTSCAGKAQQPTGQVPIPLSREEAWGGAEEQRHSAG